MTTSSNEDRSVKRGEIVWHSSEEDSGPDVGITVGLGGTAMLWCGEITKDRWQEAGAEAAELGDDFGAWLILYDGQTSTVIGKVVDYYVGREFVERISAALNRKALQP